MRCCRYLLGNNGGKLKKVSQHYVHVHINHMQIVEGLHMLLDYMTMTVFREMVQ